MNNIFVFGQSRDSVNYDDYCLIKYSQVVSIKTISSEVPDKFSLSQNYPNPFNPTTRIGFRIAEFGSVTLNIYDIQGRKIHVLVDQKLSPGDYDIDFDGSNFPSGVYYYRMEVNSSNSSYTNARKMVIVK